MKSQVKKELEQIAMRILMHGLSYESLLLGMEQAFEMGLTWNKTQQIGSNGEPKE